MVRIQRRRRLTIAVLAMTIGIGPIAAAETGEKEQSLTEVNKQLTNPVSNIWSLTFQFNNYILENDHWNHNMLFQPVLPISLTEDWNLINRPVIPLYNSVPHPIAAGRFRQTTAFGDIADVEMLSPAHADPWLLGFGPTSSSRVLHRCSRGKGNIRSGPRVCSAFSPRITSSACFRSNGGRFPAAIDRR
jgi:hypothetical protein